ncbi:uncharacterized protein LY79DRAFT_571115 [Colletotrichum navitas]|uniref:Uncharacterized protein n=1 Tax=Colletotrichum navitas TaxID=681940 RepID=A0AAD8PLM4_9PEZI|nr:uncharacterized protein LY79DRAFT_571115 [Colletotrichum navitas]KAK1569856.1 hypothetical protein LY79DRAFT_571115 [Colletotrichum navitas]
MLKSLTLFHLSWAGFAITITRLHWTGMSAFLVCLSFCHSAMEMSQDKEYDRVWRVLAEPLPIPWRPNGCLPIGFTYQGNPRS